MEILAEFEHKHGHVILTKELGGIKVQVKSPNALVWDVVARFFPKSKDAHIKFFMSVCKSLRDGVKIK
jgi:hypothetical protein